MTLKVKNVGPELTLHVPDDQEARERWAVTLFDLGAVSQGNAAQIAGVSRAAFLDILARENAAHFAATGAYKRDTSYTADEFAAEARAAQL